MLRLHLAEPPEVVSVGLGIHGVHRLRDVYRLPDLWQLHIYGYVGEVTIDGETHAIAPGSISVTPADAQVEFAYRGRSEHLYVHFRPSPVGEPVSVPFLHEAGPATAGVSELVRSALEASPSSSARATADVWAALWRVAELGSSAAAGDLGMHPAVATAISRIEAGLAQPLTVPSLARAAGVSHTHLSRLFRAETGSTVVGYIRHRRMEQARHLLVSSTLSIPAIASSVGIPDLQSFNKACRRELGGSPRTVRRDGLSRSGPPSSARTAGSRG